MGTFTNLLYSFVTHSFIAFQSFFVFLRMDKISTHTLTNKMPIVNLLAVLFMGFYLLTACSGTDVHSTATETDPVAHCTQLVNEWNQAHHPKNLTSFEHLFADSVLFYQTSLDKKACIQAKTAFFRTHPDYSQQILGSIHTHTHTDTEITCTFAKRVTLNQQTKDYPSYLMFRKTTDGWQIVTEGDSVTDLNLAKKKERKQPVPENAVSGDFNGDGKTELVWLVAPQKKESALAEDMECIGECNCLLKFSTPALPTLPITNCIGGIPVNEGDLNGDGADEIGLLPDWWTSCWHGYLVYTFQHQQWVSAVPAISTHCSQWEDGVDAISKDSAHPGYVIIRYSVMTDDALVVKTKSVPVNPY